ncbi:hypothetical protein C8R46DRAFT_1037619 [Mycena filopes]|nr:hypothetical protein C8R46DRAFT_1037619 [Mycena filopes]
MPRALLCLHVPGAAPQGMLMRSTRREGTSLSSSSRKARVWVPTASTCGEVDDPTRQLINAHGCAAPRDVRCRIPQGRRATARWRDLGVIEERQERARGRRGWNPDVVVGVVKERSGTARTGLKEGAMSMSMRGQGEMKRTHARYWGNNVLACRARVIGPRGRCFIPTLLRRAGIVPSPLGARRTPSADTWSQWLGRVAAVVRGLRGRIIAEENNAECGVTMSICEQGGRQNVRTRSAQTNASIHAPAANAALVPDKSARCRCL